MFPGRWEHCQNSSAVVRVPGLGAAAAPACGAGGCARRRKRAADRADRRRQDAGRLSAHPGRSGRTPARRPAHALRQPAEGAGRRYRAQPDAAGRRTWSCRQHRHAHRRHPPASSAVGSARQPPEHPAHHPGKPRRFALAAGRGGHVRGAVRDRHRRGARARRHQARRPTGAVPRAARPRSRRRPAASACPPPSPTAPPLEAYVSRRGSRDGASDRGHRRRAAGYRHDAAGGPAALVRPHGPGRRAGNPGAHPRRRHDHRVRQHARAGRTAVPGTLETERRDAADRHPPRQPRTRAAPARRGGDGRGQLRAVVATSSLDLGIDWGGVDQVLQVGAPKGVSRLLQRVGRANHRMDEPSQRHPGAGQPLRGAGMRGRDPGRRRARTGRRPAAAGRARRAGAAHPGGGLRRAVPARRRCTPKSRRAAPYAAPRRGRISTTCCASSRTAAMRSPPTSASANCSATPRAACTSASRTHRRASTA